MTHKNTNRYKWAYLPILFSSVAVINSQALAGDYQAQESRQVSSVGHQYVGGKTRIGVSVTDEGDVSADINQVFSETENSSTSGGLWAGFDLDGEDKGVDAGGVQVNHNWVARDAKGNATHVNKAFAAYDRNTSKDAKVTVGYGQERASGFWEGHVSKGVSDKRLVVEQDGKGKAVYEKAYDYGVGGSVGTFLAGSNTKVRAGLDHQWGEEEAANEERAMMTTLSAGVEKFFQGTPHSVGLDVAASRKQGGYTHQESDKTQTSAKLSYHYDFGGANIYQPDQRYRRVRVEIPGKGRAATYAKKPVYKQQPIYKQQPVYKNQPIYKNEPQYINQQVQVAAGAVSKSTVELEGQTFFKYGSAVLIPSAQQRLRQIAAEIRKHGYKGNIRITGNSCGLGDPRHDQVLSQQRAHAVRNFMIAQGFNPAHLVARGLGKAHSKYSTTADQDFKNRRVDIEYVSERVQGGQTYRTENRRVQNGYRKVIAGYKRVQVGTKNVQVGVRNVQTGTTDILVSKGAPGTPRVIWRTEAIATSPAWVTRALRSNFSHNRSVDTYRTTAGSTTVIIDDNKAPTAVDDSYKVNMNETIVVKVLDNDTDPENDSLKVVHVTESVKGGKVSVDSDGKITYTPAQDFHGVDTFQYTISDGNGQTSVATVTMTVSNTAVVNQAPKAANDYATTDMGMAVTINVLNNDDDPDGDNSQLYIKRVGDAEHGKVVIKAGSVEYIPDTGFSGSDSFSYVVEDLEGATSTATVTVTVKKGVGTGCVTVCTEANIDDVLIMENEVAHVNVLENDTGKGIYIVEVSHGENGKASFSGETVSYTPNKGFVGKDVFWYAIKDETGYQTSNMVMVYVEAAKK